MVTSVISLFELLIALNNIKEVSSVITLIDDCVDLNDHGNNYNLFLVKCIRSNRSFATGFIVGSLFISSLCLYVFVPIEFINLLFVTVFTLALCIASNNQSNSLITIMIYYYHHDFFIYFIYV